MLEVEHHYIGAVILLPKGDDMERGHVVAPRQDDNGNVMDRAYMNPILNTRMYQIEFIGGKVTE